jgi:hypothetical protein
MKSEICKFSSIFVCFAVLAAAIPTRATENYMKNRGACSLCDKIDSLVGKIGSANQGNKETDYVLDLAQVIKNIKLGDQRTEMRKRQIFSSIKACLEIMKYDFDGETGIALLDLREQNRKDFDYVFERLPLDQQKTLLNRFNALFERNLREKRPLPKAHEPVSEK